MRCFEAEFSALNGLQPCAKKDDGIVKTRFVVLIGVVVGFGNAATYAQSSRVDFQPRSSPAQVRTVAAEIPAVSQDLLQVYENTKLARSEEQVSSIISDCRAVLAARGRSKIDRDYALSLLAWALNRRGEMRSDRAAQLVEQGQLDMADQVDRQAAEDFEAAVQYAPNNWRTHHNYAISLAMKGNYQKAIEELSQAIELKPDYANALFNRGELYFELGDYSNAVADYSSAIALNSQDAQYFNSRGHSFFMLEQYERALADYRKATEVDRSNAGFQTDLADAYQYMGMWQQAAQAYQAAVASDNLFARAYQNAAWLMATCPDESLRNPQLSLAAARKAIELSERSSRGLDTLAAANAVSGKMDEAVRLQSQAIALADDEKEKRELSQRLEIYRRGSMYLQPKPLSLSSVADGSDSEGRSQPIRAASGGGQSRSR